MRRSRTPTKPVPATTHLSYQEIVRNHTARRPLAHSLPLFVTDTPYLLKGKKLIPCTFKGHLLAAIRTASLIEVNLLRTLHYLVE
jgi:hypothetical protein